MKCPFIVVLTWSFLSTNNVKHLFMCLLAIYVFFCEMSLQVLFQISITVSQTTPKIYLRTILNSELDFSGQFFCSMLAAVTWSLSWGESQRRLNTHVCCFSWDGRNGGPGQVSPQVPHWGSQITLQDDSEFQDGAFKDKTHALAGVSQWLNTGLQSKGSLVQFPVRAHAWVAGQVPSRGDTQGATTHWCFSPSLSPSLPLSLKINE